MKIILSPLVVIYSALLLITRVLHNDNESIQILQVASYCPIVSFFSLQKIMAMGPVHFGSLGSLGLGFEGCLGLRGS